MNDKIMSERATIEAVSRPNTRQSLAQDLRQLGLQAGMTVLTHSSLSALGWVNGGPVAVIQALMDVLTPEGTLVMPTHSGEYSDPAKWQYPPVPTEWHAVIRETMPLFDPAITPTRSMGRISELFRTWPGVQRSFHPLDSFAAWGKRAIFVTENHALSYSLGENSPLARVYDLDGYVLLLGVGYGNNTSFHLSEHRAPGNQEVMLGAPGLENGRRIWQTFPDIEINEDVFPEIGDAFEQVYPVYKGLVGKAECRLFSQRAGVDFAQAWITSYRGEG